MSIFILIPLLPLLASLVIALGGNRLGEASHKVAIPAVGIAFGLSVVAFVEVVRNGSQFIPVYQLLQSGELVVDFELYLDQLSVLLLLLVTGVSTVVHVYSSRYMIGDPRYRRFFAIIALFTFAMVTLVMSNNLLLTYMCWEAMGICSYLLISHWAERKAACQAATKAFLVNAVADVGLGLGVILTFSTFRTLDIQQILARAESISGQSINLLSWAGLDWPVSTSTLIVLLLLMGALGKSAQIPFHVWLPFAMEAPTPVSALIHAATMVNAGPFLLVRFSPLLVHSTTAMSIITVIGGCTALFAAVVSLTQTDIKRILAYSTISQIGFMFMMCGVGAFVAAIFHLLAHGFLKGYLFLSTGNSLQSVAAHGHHAAEPNQRPPPVGRNWSVAIGALIFACIPPFLLFSGPYEAMWTAQQFAAAKYTFWAVGLLTTFFTAMYLFRGVEFLFQQGIAVRESGSTRSQIQPQLFSASHLLFIAVGGFGLVSLLLLLWSWFVEFLTPAVGRSLETLPEHPPSTVLSMWSLLPLLAALGGWCLAYLLHRLPSVTVFERSSWLKSLYVMFVNKFYVDEIYDAYLVRPTIRFANWLWHKIEIQGIDRVVNGTATASVFLAQRLWQTIDVRGIQGSVERLGSLVDGTSHALEVIEPRTLQHHLMVVVYGVGVAIGLLYWLVL